MHSKETLDFIDDSELLKDVTAILWNIDLPGYELAASLNKIYNIHFVRQDAIDFTPINTKNTTENEPDPLPYYSYYSSVHHIGYYLIDNISMKSTKNPGQLDLFKKYNKILILKGANVVNKLKKIGDDFFFSTMFTDEYDILQTKRRHQIAALRLNNTQINLIDLTDPEHITLNGKELSQRENKKMQRDFIGIIDCINFANHKKMYTI